MNADFLFATFDLRAPASKGLDTTYAFDPAEFMAIELVSMKQEAGRVDFALLISTADSVSAPKHLRCRAAFSNCVVWSDRLREQGFRTVDASIVADDGGLPRVRVVVPFFADDVSRPDEHTARDDEPFVSLRTDDGQFPSEPLASLEGAAYHQMRASPSMALPKTEIATLDETIAFKRVDVREVGPGNVSITIADARFPKVMPIAINDRSAVKVWRGQIDPWPPAVEPSAAEPGSKPPPAVRTVSYAGKEIATLQWESPPPAPVVPGRLRRDDALDSPTFVFRGVESIGFRVDLSQLTDDAEEHLRSLLEPLNFHIQEGHASGRLDGVGTTAFEYRAATSAITFELLRYDKMLLDQGNGVFSPDDYVSQHELVVRILVGRVDDDTAQARDPAIFVPAVFVDNPWSRLVGRETQGFDKVLADFCVGEGEPLTMQGFEHGKRESGRRSLGEVSELRLVRNRDCQSGTKDTFLRIDCPSTAFDSDAAFEPFDLRSQLGSTLFSGSRWRQNDFNAMEFRRSFARTVVDDGLNRFRSIQVSPVDDRGLPKAWIRGEFELTDLKVMYPAGVSTLTLSSASGNAPRAWRRLCDVFGAEPLSVTTGDWYRLRCSMKLTVDDGLG